MTFLFRGFNVICSITNEVLEQNETVFGALGDEVHTLYHSVLYFVTEPSFTWLMLLGKRFVRNIYIEFRENPTNGLVDDVDHRWQAEGRATVPT